MYALMTLMVALLWLTAARVLADPWPPVDSVRAVGAVMLFAQALRSGYACMRIRELDGPWPTLGYVTQGAVLVTLIAFVCTWKLQRRSRTRAGDE
jgi:hypothetical protein